MLPVLLGGCGYNTLQATDQGELGGSRQPVSAPCHLIPDLVETAKAFVGQERDVLLGVTNARSKVGSIQATPELVNAPQAFAQFTQAQGGVSAALSRPLVVAENYPQLKSSANFRDLQAQLEGTENRITVARKRCIDAVREYNIVARPFPSNLTAILRHVIDSFS